jgi:DNA-binding winged helix-turn-helix (wHTH) protein
VLLKLPERPGELVAREELRRTIWSANTFVDFDAGLNTVINRLRGVLRDSAEVPHFIETVPKLGYRFIASVERTDREHHAPIAIQKPTRFHRAETRTSGHSDGHNRKVGKGCTI